MARHDFTRSETTLNEGYAYRETIGPQAADRTVLEYLTTAYSHSSRGDWLERIEARQVLLDDTPVEPTDKLRVGQTLVWRRPPWREPVAPLGFAILYRDDHLLAVAKPSGLPTLPGGGFLIHTLLSLVRKHHPEATPLHRLGRGTSGVMLFGRTDLARRVLMDAWEERVVRIYRTLVSGVLERDELYVEVPIGQVPHPLLGTVHGADPEGKASRSRVRLIERRSTASLVQVELITGRPHQVRIHLAAAGHPLVGDPLYRAGGLPAPGSRALPGDLGYLLHAERVWFPHPATAVPVEIECLPPPSLRSSSS